MRRFYVLALPLVCLLMVQFAHAQFQPLYGTTLQEEEANDTPACTAIGAPSYCYLPANQEPPLSTASVNQNPNINPPIQTVTVDATGHLAPARIQTSADSCQRLVAEHGPER